MRPCGRSILQLLQRGLILFHRGLLGQHVFLILLRNALDVGGFALHSIQQVGAIFLLQVSDLLPLKNRSVRIGIAAEAAGTLNDGTEALTLLDPVRAGMNNFTGYSNRRAHIFPAGKLLDRKNVAIAQTDVGVRLIGHGFRNRHGHMVTDNFAALLHFVTSQVGFAGVGTALEAAGKTDQSCGSQIARREDTFLDGPLRPRWRP